MDEIRKIHEMSEVEDVVNKFNILDNAVKNVFSKVDPLLVVSLIFDRNANEKHIYTVEAILKFGEDIKPFARRLSKTREWHQPFIYPAQR